MTTAAPAVPAPQRGRVPRWAAVALALAAGGALLVSFPTVGLWWCAPVGVALLAVAVHRRGFWAGTGLGLLAGLAFLVPLLSWTRIVGGTAPWLILSTAEAAFLAVAAGAAAWCSPLVDRYRWSWPLVTAALWTGQEALRDRYPFGGFPWGRLAFSQAGSPLLHYAVAGGAPLVTFLVALAGGLLAAAVWRRGRTGAALAAGAVLVVAAGLLVPAASPGGPTVTVAIVQGNVPRLGLEFNAQRRAVLDNHVDATLDLAARVRTGAVARPDLVVWPENSSDIDPLIAEDADARERISEAADAIGAPILLGTLLTGPGEHLRNVALVWQPGTGPGDRYVKRHPVPFAEYMPWRSFARLVSDRVDLVRWDFVPGDRPGVLRVGPATVGVAICFEVAYDNLVRDTVTGGAQLLAVQTNNADFNPAEAGQQLAMVRLRAVEHGRDGLMVSTVGISAFVDARGRTVDATGFNAPAVAVRDVRLGAARTLADELGSAPEYMLAGLGVLALFAAGWRRTRRTVQRSDTPGGSVSEDTATPERGDGYPGVGRVLVVIPTYNEADNVRIIVDRVRKAVPGVDVLVADDNSPDGTGAIADELAAADPQVHVLHRPGKQGLGAAYVAGFGWAREHGYEAVVEMDADGSHAPEQLHRLLDALRDADAVIGSRYVPGGEVLNWPRRREVLSRGGSLYTRICLGVPYRDTTAGYRAYRMPVLEKIEIDSVVSQGYCFQIDLTWRTHKCGFRVVEVPITFAERERGASKMSSRIVREALWRVGVWGTKARLEALRQVVGGKRG